MASQSVPLAGPKTRAGAPAGTGSTSQDGARSRESARTQSRPAAGSWRGSSAQAWTNTRPLRLALVALVVVLIGFRWLHLILALETTSTGRQIQIRTADLHRIERENASLQAQIAEAVTPGRMAAEAARMGYVPRTPIYVRAVAAAAPAGETAERNGAAAGPSSPPSGTP